MMKVSTGAINLQKKSDAATPTNPNKKMSHAHYYPRDELKQGII
jgi:hypothetical protein